MDTIWYLYLLRCADDTLYCGICRNVEHRLAMHNGLLSGGAKYTRGRRPVHLELAVPMPDKSSALRAEIQLKSCPREKKLQRLAEISAAQCSQNKNTASGTPKHLKDTPYPEAPKETHTK